MVMILSMILSNPAPRFVVAVKLLCGENDEVYQASIFSEDQRKVMYFGVSL